MTAGIYHINIEQGSTYNRTLTYKQSNGNPVNLSGFTAQMHMRKNIDDAATVLELSTSNNRITLGGSNGTIALTITATDTGNFPAIEGVYDLEINNGSDIIEKVIAGTFTVTKQVTR